LSAETRAAAAGVGATVVTSLADRFVARLGVAVSRMCAALEDGPADSSTLHDLEQIRFTWFEKDIANAESMAAEGGFAPTVRRLMRSVSVPGMAALLSDAGTIELDVDPVTGRGSGEP
jgi:hypothetical protein